MYVYDEDIIIKQLQDPVKRRDAFARVVTYYREQLYWQIRKLVLSHDDADDLLQNTFMKAWNNIEYFRAEARMSTWLYRIALNESLTFLTKQRQQMNVSVDADDSFLLDKLQADDYFDGDDLQRKLQEAIVRLPEKQRIVFNLRYYDEMKYDEISQILGTSVGALKASYHHAAKKIEEYLLTRD